jgi:hypothetical protein
MPGGWNPDARLESHRRAHRCRAAASLIKGSVPGSSGRADRASCGEGLREAPWAETHQQQGASATINAPDALFAREFSEALVHQLVIAYQANAFGTRAQRIAGRSAFDQPWRPEGNRPRAWR